jgi:hypothetical protein
MPGRDQTPAVWQPEATIEMKKRRWAGCLGLLCLYILLSGCVGGEEVTAAAQSTAEPESEISFSDTGTALLSIPSLNGNQIEIRITKPEGDGPFPALIGVAGGNGYFVYKTDFVSALQEMGIE